MKSSADYVIKGIISLYINIIKDALFFLGGGGGGIGEFSDHKKRKVVV